MRLARVLLDVAAHVFPFLPSEKHQATLRTIHIGREQQRRTQPAAQLLLVRLVRQQTFNTLKVSELLSLATLISHHELAALARLVDRRLERVGDEVEPTPRHVMPAGANAPRDLEECCVRYVRVEQLHGLARALRLLSVPELPGQALLVEESLRQGTAEAIDRGNPDVALGTSSCRVPAVVHVDAECGCGRS